MILLSVLNLLIDANFWLTISQNSIMIFLSKSQKYKFFKKTMNVHNVIIHKAHSTKISHKNLLLYVQQVRDHDTQKCQWGGVWLPGVTYYMVQKDCGG
jgi:hypothetical protein